MSGSTLGKLFRVTTWGESHGAGVGAVVDGVPAGLSLCEEDIQKFLDRRKPGSSQFTTQRSESDTVHILSGVFEGKTTGTPISLLINNTSQISKDYSNIQDVFRPGHADFGFFSKYGFRDYRGGGRSSGRETAGRVAAGAIAVKMLEELGVTFATYVTKVGAIEIDRQKFDMDEVMKNSLFMPDHDAAEKASEYLSQLMAEKDSCGSEVECVIHGLKPGIGEPVFDKLDARLAQGIMSIGAVKAFELGDGKAVSDSKGSINNDPFRMENGSVVKSSNHSGGTLGGMSDGADIVLRASFKPTPSIFQNQETVNEAGANVDLAIKGRHDPIIGPRAAVVVECMSALVIADLLLENCTAKLDNVKKVYLD